MPIYNSAILGRAPIVLDFRICELGSDTAAAFSNPQIGPFLYTGTETC